MSILSRSGAARPSARAESRLRRSHWIKLGCESLEHRQLLSASATAAPLSPITVETSLHVLPLASPGSTALTPQQIQNAYGVNRITFSGGTVSGNGAGQTIAIVDPYNDPNIKSDLAAFDSKYGLAAPPSFTVVNLGTTTTDPGWALETALDVEWAHAIAPAANIVLVEASSASLSGLLSAVSYASAVPGVSVVSMSWGTNEFYGEWNYMSAFTTPAGHYNVAFVAASGDQGAWSGPMFPSVAPNVLAVGGTTLTLASGNSYGSETGWTYSTGGFSGFNNGYFYGFAAPSSQTATLAAAGLNYGIRTTPDVSFNADPSSGVSVYDSVSYNGQSGWFQVGGTSAAAPAWAGLIAIADQGLAAAGVGPLSTTQVLWNLYSLPSSAFNNITSGFNGYSATSGYNLVTGLGSPKADLVVAGLLAANGVSGSAAAVTSTATVTVPSATSSGNGFAVVTTSNNGSGGSGSGSTSGSSSTSSGSLNTSNAIAAPISTSSISVSGLAALPALALNTQLGVPNTQSGSHNAPAATPASQGTTAPSSLGQSLLQPYKSIVWETSDPPETARLIDAIEPSRTAPTTPPETPIPNRAPVLEPAPAEPAAEPAQPPAAPAQPMLDPTEDDFHDALAQVSGSLMIRRVTPLRIQAADREESRESRPAFGVSALVGTAAIAAGYRFVLRGSDDQKLRRWWSARFPTT